MWEVSWNQHYDTALHWVTQMCWMNDWVATIMLVRSESNNHVQPNTGQHLLLTGKLFVLTQGIFFKVYLFLQKTQMVITSTERRSRIKSIIIPGLMHLNLKSPWVMTFPGPATRQFNCGNVHKVNPLTKKRCSLPLSSVCSVDLDNVIS